MLRAKTEQQLCNRMWCDKSVDHRYTKQVPSAIGVVPPPPPRFSFVVKSGVCVTITKLNHWIIQFYSSRWLSHHCIWAFSIFTLSNLGDLWNLIGSLSRTIQQHLPPSEWIMCELDYFSHDFRERAFKSRQNPRVDFFLGKKRLRRIQNGIFPFTVAEFCGR